MELKGKRIAILVDQLYQEMEVWYPLLRLREAGADVTTIGPEAGGVYKSKLGYPVRADISIADASAADFDAVVVPGGWAPDYMRRDPRMVDFVREADTAGKPIAARPTPAWEYAWRWAKRYPLFTGMIATTLLALLAAVVTLALTAERITRKERETAGALDREREAVAGLDGEALRLTSIRGAVGDFGSSGALQAAAAAMAVSAQTAPPLCNLRNARNARGARLAGRIGEAAPIDTALVSGVSSGGAAAAVCLRRPTLPVPPELG